MTLFIAICDDEKQVSAELERAVINILNKWNVKHEIDVYYTGEALCKKMETGAYYDLIFLDIVFARNAITGVDAGRFIRERQKNNLVSIVYISWEMKYSMQLFDIRPLNFLIKPLKYSKIEQVLKTQLELTGFWSSVFTYKIGHDAYKVQLKEIMYLQSIKRKLVLHLSTGDSDIFYGTLKDVFAEQLQRFDFLFIHASYAVNYDYIAAMKYNELFIINNALSLPIAQHRRIEVREAYYSITERRKMS